MIKTAILVDGGYYRKRVVNYYKRKESPADAANTLYKYCQKHLAGDKEDCSLYRVFYYDCPPSDKRVYHPLQKKTIDLKAGSLYQWTESFLNELRNKRKFAVRLGVLADEQAIYNLKPSSTKELLSGRKTMEELTDDDFYLSIRQKGIDTRIGIDIVTMALKKQIEKIILIAGDSDFVPAAKFARCEGIDFVLDPMWNPIKPELNEHIDGLKSFNL